jgi:hypothetical protein
LNKEEVIRLLSNNSGWLKGDAGGVHLIES